MESFSVLVVDDEPAFLRMLSMLLRLLGYEPIPATTAEAALAVLEDKRPSLVLTDVYLPGMDGLELARAIKGRQELAATPVLLMSGFERPVSHEADGFIGKPFHIDELSAAIARCARDAR